jgi:hypothetical protein
MKRTLAIALSTLIFASVGTVTQASAHEKAHTQTQKHTQQCVGPVGFCTPYFGS